MGIFDGKGLVIQGLRFLAPKDALAVLNEGALLVDLRLDELAEMKAFKVPGTIRIPHEELPGLLAELPTDRPLLLADSSGVYTKEAAHLLLDSGFTEVACLNGGMLLWDQEGLPVVTDAAALLQGECPCVLRPRKGHR